MFGGKKEKALEEELVQLKEENDSVTAILRKFGDEKDNLEEQLARMAISGTQIEKGFDNITGHLTQITDNSKENRQTAGNLRNEILHAVKTAVDCEKVQESFYQGIKKQNEKIEEIVEQNKHFTTPMKVFSEVPAVCREAGIRMNNDLVEMIAKSKNMSVLSLNAAIEAGRMGDSGKKFILTAEEIRTAAEEYEQLAANVSQQIEGVTDHMRELEEQVKHLNQLLKDNNITMGKVLKEHTACLESYQNGNISRKEWLPEQMADEAEQFLMREEKQTEVQARMDLQIQNLKDEFGEMKSAKNEVEQISKRMILS